MWRFVEAWIVPLSGQVAIDKYNILAFKRNIDLVQKNYSSALSDFVLPAFWYVGLALHERSEPCFKRHNRILLHRELDLQEQSVTLLSVNEASRLSSRILCPSKL